MTPQLIDLVVAGLFAGAVPLCALPLLRRLSATSFPERMLELGAPDPAEFWVEPKTLEELELARPFSERVVKPALQAVLRTAGRVLPGGGANAIATRLARAGTPRGLTVEAFLGLRLTAAVAFAIGAVLMQFLSLPLVPSLSVLATPIWTLVLATAGFILPELWLKDLARRRQKTVRRVLPDMLDMLSISVAAGLAFDSALARVSGKASNPLADEFAQYLTEIRLGIGRRDALRQIGVRAGVDDLDSFISAVIQAEQLGVSIANLLRVQSEQLRTRRRQRAEKVAQQAPLKMLFPMILFIFPSVFVVILGPALHQLTNLSGH